MKSILYDHYKETVSYVKQDLKKRDKLFIFLIINISLLFIQFANPEVTVKVTNAVAQKQLGTIISMDTNIISIFLMFMLLILLLRYYQIVIYIEKQYNYIHDTEAKIKILFGDGSISREGASYLSNYALFSDFMHIIYQKIFPILIISLTIVKGILEWKSKTNFSITFIFLMIIIFIILLGNTVYLISSYCSEIQIQKVKNLLKNKYFRGFCLFILISVIIA